MRNDPFFDAVRDEVQSYFADCPETVLSTPDLARRIMRHLGRTIDDRPTVLKALAWFATRDLAQYATRQAPQSKIVMGKLRTVRPWQWHAPSLTPHCPECGQELPQQ